MKIVHNTPEMLVIRDRAVLPCLAVLVIALVFAGLGTGAALQGDDQMTRAVGGGFAMIALPLLGLAIYLAQEHTHVFDRRRGVLLRRVRRLLGEGEQRMIPLDRVRGVELKIEREVADPDTYGVELLIERDHGARIERLALRSYTSSADPSDLCDELEQWLVARA